MENDEDNFNPLAPSVQMVNLFHGGAVTALGAVLQEAPLFRQQQLGGAAGAAAAEVAKRPFRVCSFDQHVDDVFRCFC